MIYSNMFNDTYKISMFLGITFGNDVSFARVQSTRPSYEQSQPCGQEWNSHAGRDGTFPIVKLSLN